MNGIALADLIRIIQDKKIPHRNEPDDKVLLIICHEQIERIIDYTNFTNEELSDIRKVINEWGEEINHGN